MLDIHKLKQKPMTTKNIHIVISSKCLEFPNWKKNQFKILFGPNSIAIMLQFKTMILKITKSLCNPSEKIVQGPFVNNKHHLKHGNPSQ